MTEREFVLLAGVSCVTGLIFWLAYSIAANDARSQKADTAKDPK